MAKRPVGPLDVLVALPAQRLPEKPTHLPEEQRLAEKLRAREGEAGWLILPDGRLIVPEALWRTIASQTHQSTHLGGTKLSDLIRRCQVCARVNQGPPVVATPGQRFRGQNSGEH